MSIKEKMLTIGKRWQKGDKNRVYINYSDIDNIEVDGFTMYSMFNRYSRQNMKIYYDLTTDELIVTCADDEQKAFVRKVIEAM